MKVGDIALMNNRLVRIAKLEYKKKIGKKLKGFKKVDENAEVEKELTKVWWENIGENLGLIHTEVLSASYDWKEMILAASVLKRQFDIIEQEKNKEDGTDNDKDLQDK